MSEDENRRVKIAPPRDDMERIASAAAEKAAAIVSRRVLSELKAIRDSIERIEKEIEELKNKCKPEGPREAEKRREPAQAGAQLLEHIRRRGYILASDARKLGLSPAALMNEASRQGLIVINAEGDAIIMSDQSFREFSSILGEIKTSDPEEALKAAGRYSRAFNVLRRAGVIYYSQKAGKWVMVE
ncbi:MAG: hypothetical protein P3X22_004185 [Thermoprotei archaeon]|nr:hypothetical protein [Thermoprotei archaeon]